MILLFSSHCEEQRWAEFLLHNHTLQLEHLRKIIKYYWLNELAPAGHFCWSLCISVGVYDLPRFTLLVSQIPASILHLCPPPPSVLSTSLIRRLITGPGGWGIIRLGLYTFAHSDHSLSFCLTHISSQRLLSPSFWFSWVISLFHRPFPWHSSKNGMFALLFASNQWCCLETSVRWNHLI